MRSTLRHVHHRALRTLALSIAIPFATAAVACGDTSDRDRDGPDGAVIQAALDGLAESKVGDDALGIAISVRLADGRVFQSDAGHSDPQGTAYDLAATEQVIGSVTKLYTAVLVMQLVEAGDVSLDDTVDRWLDMPDGDLITVRMLLQHTSGLADDLDAMTLADAGHAWTPQALLERALAAPRFGAPPLAKSVYTNTNALILAMILEAESGKRWEQLVAERIVAPLGLKHTYYAGEHDKAAAMAGGWMVTDAGWVDSRTLIDPSLGWGVGAMVTTNAELMRFAEAFFDGELFDDPGTLAQMLRFDTAFDPAHLGEEPDSQIGLAVIRLEVDGVRLDGHLGHLEGFNAGAVRDPDTGAIIVVTSNDDRAFAGYTILDVAHFVRDL